MVLLNVVQTLRQMSTVLIRSTTPQPLPTSGAVEQEQRHGGGCCDHVSPASLTVPALLPHMISTPLPLCREETREVEATVLTASVDRNQEGVDR